MQIKICGMREAGNVWAIADLSPDFLGFIFHKKSSRYVGDTLAPEQLRSLPKGICKVGVFVDEPLASVQATTCKYSLDYVQLHGHETPAYCEQAKALGLHVIKAFAVDSTFDFSQLTAYSPACDFFLFDAKGELPGGNGIAFDWSVLVSYTGQTPFLLSGGLGLHNLPAMLAFQHPQLIGFDLNSQLEAVPGLKNVAIARQLLTRLHDQPAI